MQAVFFPAHQGSQFHAINSRLLPISGGLCLGTMAGQLGTIGSPFPAPAAIVGNVFVNQYYNVLHQSPHVVHRFYTDASRLSRAEGGPHGIVDTTVTQAGIHEKVMSLDLGGICAEIRTVDSHESLSGSVLVMVTGALSTPNQMRRNFVQTFFLAPQENGFFVLNDMFRYLDEEPQQLGQPSFGQYLVNGKDSVPTVELSTSPTMPEQSINRSLSVDDPPVMSEEDISGDESYKADEVAVDVITTQQDCSAAAVVSELCSPSPVEEGMEDVPKLSYASILRVPKDGESPYGDRLISSTQVDHLPQLSPVHAPPSLEDQTVEALQVNGQGSNPSIYAKNLPLNITQPELEQEFEKFGKFKPDGIIVRNPKMGVCYAFIEYEDATSAQKAIEASPITIRNRQVYVEEKRLGTSRGVGGRGRLNQGRGYQNEGTRGRGYNGLYARGAKQDSVRDSGRGRGSRSARGSYGNSHSFTNSSSSTYGPDDYNGSSNGYRRSDSEGGSFPRAYRHGGSGNRIERGDSVRPPNAAAIAAN